MFSPGNAARHNPRTCEPVLPLSEVDRSPIGAGGRLTHTAARYLELHGPVAPARAFRAERIAQTIRRDGGNVWGAVLEHGISYSHACRIRAGWRPR